MSRRLAAQGLGTAFLVATVVGSGIMGERRAGGSVGLARWLVPALPADAPHVVARDVVPTRVAGGRR